MKKNNNISLTLDEINKVISKRKSHSRHSSREASSQSPSYHEKKPNNKAEKEREREEYPSKRLNKRLRGGNKEGSRWGATLDEVHLLPLITNKGEEGTHSIHSFKRGLIDKKIQLLHPIVEFTRDNLLYQLRIYYNELTLKYLGMEHPKESFNRWLIERKMSESKVVEDIKDPLLVSNKLDNKIGPSMFHEIAEDLPIKLRWPRNVEDAKRNIFRYIRAARTLLNEADESTDKIKVESKLSYIEEQMDKQKLLTQEELEGKLKQLRLDCDNFFVSLKTDAINTICISVMEKSGEYAEVMIDFARSIYHDTSDSTMELKYISARKRPSYYEIFINLNKYIHYKKFQSITKGDRNALDLQSRTVRISYFHYKKLKSLYQTFQKQMKQGEEDSSLTIFDEDKFNIYVWILVQRYRAFYGGLRKFEGSGLQAAVPPHVFSFLTNIFDVYFECCASPFNCYYPQYCSAFDDIDVLFGSCGSFLNFWPSYGSFSINPPFSEQFMTGMTQHIEELLESSSSPLSFIVFIPDWTDPIPPAIPMLQSSKFFTSDIVFEAKEHHFCGGSIEEYNTPSGKSRSFTPVHKTRVLWMQNVAGKEKWYPSEEKIQSLRRTWLQH